jgi:hypothetical protein
LSIRPKLAHCLYGRGLAKRKKGDLVGGNADIDAAVATRPAIAAEFANYGINDQ